jgi:hypothetical protein
MAEICGKYWSRWDGEYEGECVLEPHATGSHWDGMAFFDDQFEEVRDPTPEDQERYMRYRETAG